MLPLDMESHTRHKTLQGCLEEYSLVLQDGHVLQLAWKLHAEINKSGNAGGYLADLRPMRMDESGGTENWYVGFAGWCHALFDQGSAGKADFLSARCVASMMTSLGFASQLVDEILKNKPVEKSRPLTKRMCHQCHVLAAGYACSYAEVSRICNLLMKWPLHFARSIF